MNLGDFRALITQYNAVDGQPYVADTDTANLNVLINERLRAFTDETLCLDADNVALTLVGGTAVYDFRSASVASSMSRVHRVIVNGQPLVNHRGEPGAYPYNLFDSNYPNYLTDPQGLPARYRMMQPTSFRLHPTPDQAYPNCFVAGQKRHPVLAADGDLLVIPEEIIRTAAVFCWVTLSEPWAGPALLERMGAMSPHMAKQMEGLLEQGESKRNLGTVRNGVRTQSKWKRVGVYC